ncbi:hypothetical protein ILUMI_14951 [Ignelater luminosus]|uniref:DDE-1 domain-containing protein n=1 Tax=Ignelater luminosus TaxID=2038154 RepID=A0A8K0G7B5_IGNLU|nr:hypothetical protein ILUMI_14951 [Ignelater luminosus]
MREAVELVAGRISLRNTAKLKNIKCTTLHCYVRKKKATGDGAEIRKTPRYAVQKLFLSELEDSLEQYLVTCSKVCYGLDTLKTRRLMKINEMAKFHNRKIPKAWKERQMAGIDWLYGFRKRHPEIRLRKPEACLGQRLSTDTTCKSTLNLAQPTGWMTGKLFANVIRHFIKMTFSTKENPTLVIMDNHESHLAPEVLNIAKENRVILLTIPPHTSHKLQTLDVSVFGPFQNFYNAAVDSWMVRHPQQTMTIYNVAELVGQAFDKSMTPSNIKSGFKKTGIFPFDRDIPKTNLL